MIFLLIVNTVVLYLIATYFSRRSSSDCLSDQGREHKRNSEAKPSMDWRGRSI